MPKFKTILDEAMIEKFREVLSDGTPPFFELAADRIGVPRPTAKNWMYDPRLDPNETVQQFRRVVRQVRGEYIARHLKLATEVDKNNSEGARQMQWILTCLDREMLDAKRNSYKTEDEKRSAVAPAEQQAPDAVDVKKAEEDLAIPEAVH